VLPHFFKLQPCLQTLQNCSKSEHLNYKNQSNLKTSMACRGKNPGLFWWSINNEKKFCKAVLGRCRKPELVSFEESCFLSVRIDGDPEHDGNVGVGFQVVAVDLTPM
jgi:hypothetical protein